MKKTLFFSVLAVLLLGVGVGAFLYANSQKTTFSPTTLSPNLEPVFTYMDSPPEQSCMAYVYSYWDDNTMQTKYIVTTSIIDNVLDPDLYPEIPTIRYFFVTSREGTVMDCVECTSRCSAFYELCDEYGVEYDY